MSYDLALVDGPQPIAGDLVFTCRHLPDPWGERCVLYALPRSWTFRGVNVAHEIILTVDGTRHVRERRWLLVCGACEGILDRAEPARKHEAASDLVGASTIWRADLPPIQWRGGVREQREVREVNVAGLWVPIASRKVDA